jgi:hypothetical protein
MKTKVVHCKLEPYDVYIGRPSIFGNPFSHKKGTKAQFLVGSIREAIDEFRKYVYSRPELIAQIKEECTGKVLGCWCRFKPTDPCHGDVIVEICEGKEEI